jgi:NitT/TauT family transport system permease protein
LTVDGQILDPLVISLQNLALGFVISVVGGVGVGLLMGIYPKVGAALSIYVWALMTAPALVFAPIFFAFWALGRETTIAIIVTYAIFVIMINTSTAIRGVPSALLEMASSFGASRAQLLFRIMLPAAAPLILAGIRVGAGTAVRGMINGEMFIAVVGLGAVVMGATRRFDAEPVLAIFIVIVAVSMALMKQIGLIDRRLTGWLPENTRAKTTFG